MRRSLVVGTVLAAFLFALPLSGGEAGPVILLGDASYPPMTYADHGVAKGLVIDILRAVERRVGRQFDIRLMPWDQAQEAVRRGEGDGLCQMGITEQRRQLYDFTEPVLESQYSIYVRSDRPGLAVLPDLHGLRVGVTAGGLPRQLIQDDPTITAVTIADYEDGFVRLRGGQVDAVIADRWVGAYILAQHGIRDVRVGAHAVATRPQAIAVRKGDAALLGALDQGIRDLKADGTIARIAAEWQPKEVVYLTREQVWRQTYGLSLVVLAVLLTAAVAWAVTLRREVAVRRRTEAALRGSEARFRAIFEQAPTGIAIIDVPSVRPVEVNPAFCAIVGRTAEDLVGGDLARLTHPDDRAATAAAARALNQGEVDRIALLKRYLRPDGTAVWVELVAISEHLPGQAPTRTIALVNDVTERRRAEEERRRSAEEIEALHERLALATRSAGIGIWDWDVPRDVLVWDEEMHRIFDVPPTEFGGAYAVWSAALHPDDRERAEAEVRAALSTGVFESEFRIRRADGAVRTIHASGRAFRDPAGVPLRLIGINYDVTERREAEDALRQHRENLAALVAARTADLDQARANAVRLGEEAAAANRAKSVFLASMSHEIRTPLNAILGYAQLLVRDRSLASEHRRAVEVINRSGEHLLSLISDILEMSRIEAGRCSVDPEDFDLHELLGSLRSLFLLRARDKGLQLDIAIAPGVPRFVRTDQRKLRQILVNLVSNAVKFTAAGEVAVAASYVDGVLRLDIRDTGPGISESDQERLFQPFVQVGSGRGRGEGSGLGLAISLGFARVLGGDLALASQAGCGALFTLRLPVALAERATQSAVRRREAVGLAPECTPRRILIAEDHVDSRRLLQELFVGLGLEVRAVGDGAAAVAACQDWAPHLVWMDIDMPIMDGLAAARAIRALPGVGPVIVALTAAAFVEDRARILAGGCDEVVRKPYREEELLQLLERRLGLRFLWRDALSSPVATSPPLDDDLANRAASLAPQELGRLREAILIGDIHGITAVAAGWEDRVLAERVIALADGLAMDRLAALLEPSQSEGL